MVKPWNAPIAVQEMQPLCKPSSLSFCPHSFSPAAISLSQLHPPFPAGEVVSCPEGTWGSPPSCSCVEDNTAYFGNNARVGSSNPQPSRAACARSCREHEECQFWTWGKGSPMGPCYLKHSRDNVSPGLTSYVSGSKLCVLPESEGKPDELDKSGIFLKSHGFLPEIHPFCMFCSLLFKFIGKTQFVFKILSFLIFNLISSHCQQVFV